MAPTPWYTARVVAIHDETPHAKTFRLRLPTASDHLAGQHVVVRLTAPDGYTAQRSYSVASAPDGSDLLDLTVELLADGEVSSFLHEVVEVGDELELRGPLGGFFVWDGTSPALLIGGGSGIVPLMAMLRLARRSAATGLVHLVASVRSPADLYYAAELDGPDVTVVHTRRPPPGSTRPPGRLTADDLRPFVGTADLTAYVCGSAGFCNAAGDLLVALGHPAARVRTERFGPTAAA